MQRMRVTTIYLLLVIVIAGSAGVGVAQQQYDLSTDSDVSVPSRTVERLGGTFEISAVAKADPGDTLDVSIDAPDTNVTVTIFDSDQQRVETPVINSQTSSFQETLESANYSAGTYGMVLTDVDAGGRAEAAHPILIRGYEVNNPSVSDTSVTAGTDVTLSADIQKLRGDDGTTVEFVLANENTRHVETSSIDGDGEYSATFETGDLSGSYEAIASVRGSDTVLGQKERLGVGVVSGSDDLTVSEPEDTATESGGGGGGGGGGAAGVATEASTPSSTQEAPSGTSAPESQDQNENVDQGPAPVVAAITDAQPDESGTTVDVGGSSVDEVTFDTSDTPGGSVLAVGQSAEITETFSDQFGDDRVKAAVDITPPEQLRDNEATIEFRLTDEEIGETSIETLQVVRQVDSGVQLLSTDVESDENGVVITAETPGFSEFAVVSIEEDTPTGTEANAEDTGTDNDGVTTPSEEVSESPTTPVSTPTGIIGILGVLGIIAFLIGRTIKN